jgi:uncharacterized membrane protein
MAEHPLIATHSSRSSTQLARSERSISFAIGGALLINGIRSGGLSGLLQIGLGTVGVIRGLSGRCALKSALTHTPFESEFQDARGWKDSEAISRSVTINKPMSEVVAFIRKPENIAPLIPWVDKVESISLLKSIWTISAPLGYNFQWSLKLEDDQSDTLHWSTEPDSDWQHDVTAHFKEAPSNRGTEVKLVIVGKTPLGKIGYAVANSLAQFTDKILLNLLYSIKQQLETGEVSTNHMRPDHVPGSFYVHPPTGEPSVVLDQSSAAPVKTGIVLEGGNL